MARGDPVGLECGVMRDHVPRVGVGGLMLGHLSDHDLERQSRLREQFATPRRSRRKNQTRQSCGDGHAATQ